MMETTIALSGTELNSVEYFTAILDVLGPVGALIAVVMYFTMKSRATPDKFLEELARRVSILEARNKELEDTVAKLREELVRLQIENANLLTKITLLESNHQSIPLPMWLKDEHGKVLAINSAYEVTFLKPLGFARDNYVGHTDKDVWPDDIARIYRENDERVFNSGVTFVGSEPVLMAHGEIVQWKIINYPRFAGSVKIGIGGIAVPPDSEVLLDINLSSAVDKRGLIGELLIVEEKN